MRVDEYAAEFHEEPGYLDFARIGPLGREVAVEQARLTRALERAGRTDLAIVDSQADRVISAVSDLIGFGRQEITFQPSTSQGLMHVAFGVSGRVLLSSREFPSLRYAAQRSWEAGAGSEPAWFDPPHGLVTPETVRATVDASIEAVAVSVVDFRTGYLADLDGIREVIGDRILIVDATQALGVVDAPWRAADVIAAGGQKWPRAGTGTAFLAVGDRIAERLSAVWSRPLGAGFETGDLVPPEAGALAFRVARSDPIAQARFATAIERMIRVGVPAISDRIAERIDRIIQSADRYGIDVVSPRERRRRAGIVVIDPGRSRFERLRSALDDRGIVFTIRGGRIRLSPHVSTRDETLLILDDALASVCSR